MKRIMIVFAALMIGASGCQQASQTGDGVKDYIQFKLDGQVVRIENCAGEGWHASDLKYHPIDSTYSLAAFVPQCDNSSKTASVVISHEPLRTENYSDRGSFRYELSWDKRYVANTSLNAVEGNITFTQVELYLDGTIKGTFNFTNATYYTDTSAVDGHTITEGEFQVKVGQYHAD